MREGQEKDKFIDKLIATDKLAQITPLLSSLDIEYQQAYNGPYEDLSWISESACVIAGLKDGKISGFGRPMVALGKPKAVKVQMERLYNISNDIYYMDYLEGGTVSAAGRFLLQRDLPVRPFYTQIIDLAKTKEELHADIRKSYKSLINQSDYTWFIDSPQSECSKPYRGWSIKHFRELHISICGRETRPQGTWLIQKRMIGVGQAFVSGEYDNRDLVSANLFCHNGHSCYYAVGKSLPDVNAHPTIWKAILHAKSLGIKTLDMGEIFFSGDQKAVNISKFKAGFGGRCYTRLLIGKE